MSLKHLHESFLEKARQPMTFGRLPVVAKDADTPIIVSNKWVKQNNSLKKTYRFRLNADRNIFLQQLVEHEEEVGHHAIITVKESEIVIVLQTADIDEVTELDKEFAKWSDELYRDVVYSLQHG